MVISTSLTQLKRWLHFKFHSLENHRHYLHQFAPSGPVKEYLSYPFPDVNGAIKDTPILSLDFETNGLNPRQDSILSVGHVDIQQWQIKLGTACHYIIRHDTELNRDNVIVHHITDDQVAQGSPREAALASLLSALRGKVMLVHFAPIERNFLRQACLNTYGFAPVFPIIDTMMVAKRLLDMRDVSYDPSALRLANLRQQYQLPGHHAHNALSDAIATAELLLAQASSTPNGSNTPLKHFLIS